MQREILLTNLLVKHSLEKRSSQDDTKSALVNVCYGQSILSEMLAIQKYHITFLRSVTHQYQTVDFISDMASAFDESSFEGGDDSRAVQHV